MEVDERGPSHRGAPFSQAWVTTPYGGSRRASRRVTVALGRAGMLSILRSRSRARRRTIASTTGERAVSRNVLDRRLGVGRSSPECFLQRDPDWQRQALVPQERREFADSASDLALVAALERVRDEPETRVTDPDRVDIEVEYLCETCCTGVIEHCHSQAKHGRTEVRRLCVDSVTTVSVRLGRGELAEGRA